jgi:Secreted repeat of unknown function
MRPTGVSGKLTVLNEAKGNQVAYNGHFLYTFTSDHAGQVTGQGFQNFFVATPASPRWPARPQAPPRRPRPPRLAAVSATDTARRPG